MNVGDQMYDDMPIDETEEPTPALLRVRAYILRYQPHPDEESAKAVDDLATAWEDDRRRLEALTTDMELIASDALWHDGNPNPEAFEDIRTLLRSLGYSRKWAHDKATREDAENTLAEC